MAGRFSVFRVAAPDLVPEDGNTVTEAMAQSSELSEVVSEAAGYPLLTVKLLDAKVQLHRRLIEEINLSALEKLPEEQIRGHVQELVSQYVLAERLALNAQELNEFVSENS